MNHSSKNVNRSLVAEATHPNDFTAIFEENFNRLLKKTQEYVKDIQIAKDIVQGIFVKVWDNHRHIIHSAYIREYLEKACVNRARNYIRDHQKFAGSEDDLLVLKEPTSADASLIYDELHDNIMQYIRQLPDRMRSAFMLSRFQQMTYKEIAKTLGISVVAVEKSMMKALKRLNEFVTRTGLRLFLLFALSSELKMSRTLPVEQLATATATVRKSTS